MRIRPCAHRDAQRAVAVWHSHHRPHIGAIVAHGMSTDDGVLVAVCVVGRPVAPALDDGATWEVTRLAVGPDAPHCAASQLLAVAWRHARVYGVRRLVSYTRADEAGTCYRAAGWVPVATVRAQDPRRSGVLYLPGVYQPTTERTDRVRWEIGPAAAPAIKLEGAA